MTDQEKQTSETIRKFLSIFGTPEIKAEIAAIEDAEEAEEEKANDVGSQADQEAGDIEGGIEV